MLRQSTDYLKKILYYAYFKHKKINKNFYLFSYFPTSRAEYHYEWRRKVLYYAARLIAMPSAFRVIKAYQLQAPQVYVIIGNIINLTFLNSLSILNGITCFLNNKWYGFFLFLELNKYNILKNLCDDTQTISSAKPLIIYRFKNNFNSSILLG